MTPLLVSLVVLCMAGVIETAIYHALYGSHRALEERFADLALKIRASQGVFEDTEEDIHGFSRLFLQWAAKRVPVPQPGTPEGEELARTLIQAGYLKSTMPQVFQVFRFGMGLLAALIGASVGIVLSNTGSMLLFESEASASEFSHRAFTSAGALASAKTPSRGSFRRCSICWWFASKQVWDCSRRSRS